MFCLMALVLVRLGGYLFGGESVDATEAVQLRIQAENDLLSSELHSLPKEELWLRVEHEVQPCENDHPDDAGCNAFLRKIKAINYKKKEGDTTSTYRYEATQALVELHHYQLSARTAKAHGAKGRKVHRAGPVESFQAVAHTFG